MMLVLKKGEVCVSCFDMILKEIDWMRKLWKSPLTLFELQRGITLR